MSLLNRIGAILFAMLVPGVAQGARFPNAVEARIVLTGEAAASIAALLGLSASGNASVSLRLGRGDAWAVYILKQDTKQPLSNDNNGSPPRYNTIAFSPSPIATLTLSPYWLDLGTALPVNRPGYYSFDSPFITGEPDPADPWTLIFRDLNPAPGWDSKAWPSFRRCFTSAEGTELCVEVFSYKDYTNNVERVGYSVRFVVHPTNGKPPPADPQPPFEH